MVRKMSKKMCKTGVLAEKMYMKCSKILANMKDENSKKQRESICQRGDGFSVYVQKLSTSIPLGKNWKAQVAQEEDLKNHMNEGDPLLLHLDQNNHKQLSALGQNCKARLAVSAGVATNQGQKECG